KFMELRENYMKFLDHTGLICWSLCQCHIAAANIMTAAALLGIDSCPIGRFDPEAVAKIVGAGLDQYEIAMVVPLGYRKGPQPERHRLPFNELVTYL
ncbi:MAG: nitroreductase family protein, partial [Burkholderiales bacterium]